MEGETIFVDIGAQDLADDDPILVTNDILEVIPNIKRGSNYIFFPNGSFSLTPTNSMVGEYTIGIRISDGNIEIPLTIKIEILNANQPPLIPSISIGEKRTIFFEDERVTLFGETTDPDSIWGDEITYQWSSDIDGNLGEGVGINVSLSPGDHTITLTVIDEGGLSNTSIIRISIKPVSDQGDPSLRTSSYLLIIGAISLIIGSMILLVFLFIRRRKDSEQGEKADETANGLAGQGASELGKVEEKDKLGEGQAPRKDLLPPGEIPATEDIRDEAGSSPSAEPIYEKKEEVPNQGPPDINDGIPEDDPEPVTMNDMMEPPGEMDNNIPGPQDGKVNISSGPVPPDPETPQGGDNVA
jgi:PKD repeat protein